MPRGHSHSIVAGGFDVTSSDDAVDGRDLVHDPRRDELDQVVRSRAQSAVIASSEVTARITIG